MKEESLYDIIERYLKEKGYMVLRDFRVGRWSPKRVDLIGVRQDSSGKELISVEVKLRRFRQIIEQAVYRLFFSDFVYIAFPRSYARHVAQVHYNILEKYGLGLLSVDRSVEILISPVRSKILNRDYKNYIIRLVQNEIKKVK